MQNTKWRLSDRNHGLSVALAAAALGLIGCASDLDSAPAPVTQPQVDADAEGAPLVALSPHWDALVRETGGAPSVRWGQRGTPMTMFGSLDSQASGASVSDARHYLAAHADLLQLGRGLDELADDATVTSPLGSHVTFSQRFEGVRVFGGEVKVHFNRAGQIIGVNNTTVPGVSLSTIPSVSAERALAVALQQAADDRSDAVAPAAPELVIYADAGAPQLAYRAVVPTNKTTLEVFVDAHTGALIGEPKDLNQYVNGTGQVFKDNAVVATQNNNLVDGNDANTAVPTAAYSTVTLQGLTGNNRLDGQFASGSGSRTRAAGSNNSFIFLRNTTAFSETMAYFHIDAAQRYIQSLGFTNVNNRQLVYSIDRSTADNSSYSPSTKQITYGTGGVDDAEDGEVIVHEYGHSVQDNQVPGFGATEEGGAMGEGFGDYLAATVNSSIAGDFQLVCIAEWDATSYAAGVPHCLRRLDSTKHYPGSKDGEVHDDGEMWSASLFQIRNSLGAARADKLILQAHFLLTSRANFKDGSNALITAAKNLGYTATEVTNVRTILVNRGFAPTA